MNNTRTSTSSVSDRPDPLFEPVALGALRLHHRIVMAPLTRMRATQPGDIPNGLMARYYRQRTTSGGLIVSEATQISPSGKGYVCTPGIHNTAQVKGWRRITDAVHEGGGLIVLQLWHVGRISHSSLLPGTKLPVSASPVAASGLVSNSEGTLVPFETPRALEIGEIPALIKDYRKGAENARKAGFDGVEIHSANGYLLDQFLQDGTNHRGDIYGGSIPNRARLLLEVVETAISVWGADRVGVRLSPFGTFNDMQDSNPVALFTHVIRELNQRQIAYLHLVEPRADSVEGAAYSAPEVTKLFRSEFKGKLISAGGFAPATAREAVFSGYTDAIAFGRWFISNPDLPDRIARSAPLNPYDRTTFYGGSERGYTDYPALGAPGQSRTAAAPDVRTAPV